MRLNNSCLKLALAALMILLPGIAWGGGYNITKWGKLTVSTAQGDGSVYIKDDNEKYTKTEHTKSETESKSSGSAPSSLDISFDCRATPGKGYQFDGWKESKSADSYKSTDSDYTYTFAADGSETNPTSKNLYGYFSEIKYTISYVSEAGTTGMPTESPGYTITTDIKISSDKPSRTGYTFDGWKASYKDASEGDGWDTFTYYQPGASISNTNKSVYGNVTLTAHWSLTSYKITYLLDGGTNSPKNPSEYYVTQSITLSEPSKEGFIFDGWTLESWSDDCNWTEKITSSTISTIPQGCIGNVELKANWVKEAAPHYIKVTVSDMKKDDHAIFDITYGSVNQQIAIHEFAIVKIPGSYATVTVTPSRWTEKTYNITPAAGYTGIDVSSGTRNNPTMFEFSAMPKSGQNIFEISREF